MSDQHLLNSNVHFIDSHTLETDDGDIIYATKIIIATGSSPVIPAPWLKYREHLLTTDDIFELEDLPESIAVIGLGVIGIELGQALNRMGVKITGIDQSSHIAGILDDEVNATAIDIISGEFPLWLGHVAEIILLDNNQLQVTSGDRQVIVDKILLSIGRKPNLDSLNLQAVDIQLDNHGIPEFNPNTMQTSNINIFIAGDCTGSRALLHEAAFEGRAAGYNAMHDNVTRFRQKTALAITFSDPNIITVGAQLPDLDPDNTAIGEIKLAPVGRALIIGKNKGLIRIYAEKSSGRILGASMISVKGENLAHLLCWCIEMSLTVQDLLKMPFYHPVIEEALQAALYDLKSKLDINDDEYPVELQPDIQ